MTCVLRWDLRPADCVNALPQWSHLYGFSPVWSLSWLRSVDACVKTRLQNWHWYGFSPVCMRAWARRLPWEVNILWQIWHLHLVPSAQRSNMSRFDGLPMFVGERGRKLGQLGVIESTGGVLVIVCGFNHWIPGIGWGGGGWGAWYMVNGVIAGSPECSGTADCWSFCGHVMYWCDECWCCVVSSSSSSSVSSTSISSFSLSSSTSSFWSIEIINCAKITCAISMKAVFCYDSPIQIHQKHDAV